MKMKFLLCLFLMVIVASCGDLKKSKTVKRIIEGSRFNAGCEIKLDEFKKIFEHEIPGAINCVEKSMDLFLRMVKTDRPGYLSRTALEDYIKNNVPDFKPENLNAIRTIFQVNHLIFGDDPDYIPAKSIKLLLNFLRTFNKEMIQVYAAFKNTNEVDDLQHKMSKDRVFRTVSLLSELLLEMYNPDRGTNIHMIDIDAILDAFKTSENDSTIAKVKSLLITKRLLLGGQKNLMNHKEFEELAYKLPQLTRTLFDFFQIQYIRRTENGVNLTQKAQLEIISNNIIELEKLLYFKPNQEEVLFNVDDLLEIVPHFTDSFPHLDNYRDSIVQLKMMIMTDQKFKCSPSRVPTPIPEPSGTGTYIPAYSKCVIPEHLPGEEKIKNSQFYYLIGHVKEILARSLSFHRIYDKYKVVLDSPLTINLKVADVLLVFPNIEKHVRDFVRISNNYRFFKGDWDAPYYDTVIRRNPEAFLMINIFEYVATLAFRRYGTVTDGVGGYGVDVDQVEQIIWLFEDFLKDQQIVLEGRAPNSSETATLMSALFQYQSNGDAYVNPNEVAEFGQSVLTALAVGEDFLDIMKNGFSHGGLSQREIDQLPNLEKCEVDKWDRVTDLSCFRKNFYPVLCHKFYKHFPRMFSWLGIKDCKAIQVSEDNEEFLWVTEQASRTCTVYKDKTEVPMGKNDMMGIFGALMNIEGTVTRWDQNGNNIMDAQEVDDAYAVFETAIRSMVRKESPQFESISKQIYFYLVRYEKKPDSKKFKNLMHFLGFLLRINKKSPASRKSIAAILKIIGESGAPNRFDCEKLREPDIPIVNP